jgi:hypothetical protein
MTSPKTLRVRHDALNVKYRLLYVVQGLLFWEQHRGTHSRRAQFIPYRPVILDRRTFRGRRVLFLNSGFFFSSAATLTVHRLIFRYRSYARLCGFGALHASGVPSLRFAFRASPFVAHRHLHSIRSRSLSWNRLHVFANHLETFGFPITHIGHDDENVAGNRLRKTHGIERWCHFWDNCVLHRIERFLKIRFTL